MNSNLKTFTDNTNHFQMNYPDKWEVKTSGNTILFLSSTRFNSSSSVEAHLRAATRMKRAGICNANWGASFYSAGQYNGFVALNEGFA
jgi:hypothetical protein